MQSSHRDNVDVKLKHFETISQSNRLKDDSFRTFSSEIPPKIRKCLCGLHVGDTEHLASHAIS